MKCSCGKELPDKAIFCGNCGKQVRCVSCNEELSPEAKFCEKCGTPITQKANFDSDSIENNDTPLTQVMNVNSDTDENSETPLVQEVNTGSDSSEKEETLLVQEMSVNSDTNEKNINNGNNKVKPIVIVTVCVIAVAVILLLSGVFSKKSIIGIWRLKSGNFSTAFSYTYETCALEFRDNGEFIIYGGENYTDDNDRGSYTYDNNQIKLYGGVFEIVFNYSLSNNQLSIVSSGGTAHFEKVDMNITPSAFDESQVSKQYTDKGCIVRGCILFSQSEDERVYHTTLAQSYKYMDEEIIREDRYAYTRIGKKWYQSSSNEYSTSESWHINGLWIKQENCLPELLRIYSFDGNKIQMEYYSSSPSYGEESLSGEINVESYRGMYLIGDNTITLEIDREKGILGFAFDNTDPNAYTPQTNSSLNTKYLPTFFPVDEYAYWDEQIKDTYGIEHTGRYLIRAWKNSFEDTAHEEYFILHTQGNWHYLRGKYFAREDQSMDQVAALLIYADNELIYDSGMINRNTGTVDFDLDIHNAEDVKIICNSNDRDIWGWPYSGISIVDAEVYNDAIFPANNKTEPSPASVNTQQKEPVKTASSTADPTPSPTKSSILKSEDDGRGSTIYYWEPADDTFEKYIVDSEGYVTFYLQQEYFDRCAPYDVTIRYGNPQDGEGDGFLDHYFNSTAGMQDNYLCHKNLNSRMFTIGAIVPSEWFSIQVRYRDSINSKSWIIIPNEKSIDKKVTIKTEVVDITNNKAYSGQQSISHDSVRYNENRYKIKIKMQSDKSFRANHVLISCFAPNGFWNYVQYENLQIPGGLTWNLSKHFDSIYKSTNEIPKGMYSFDVYLDGKKAGTASIQVN